MDELEATTVIRNNLGEKVRKLRKEQGLSQSNLPMMVGIARQYVIDIELGRKAASLDVLVRLSRGFDMSLPELIDGIDPEAPTMGASYAFGRIPKS